MKYHFGKEFVFNYYPLSEDGFDYELLVDTVFVTSYLFDKEPTEAEATSGTGAIQTVGTWTPTEDSLGQAITFDAVSVPSDLTGYEKKYYVAINTELEAGETIPPQIFEITLQKLRGQVSVIKVTSQEVLQLAPALEEHFHDCVDIDIFIDDAILDMKHTLTGCDLEHGDVIDPGKLNYAVKHLAVSKAFFNLARDVNSIYYAEGIRYQDLYEQKLAQIQLEIDKNRDGKSDGTRSGNRRGLRSFRILR